MWPAIASFHTAQRDLEDLYHLAPLKRTFQRPVVWYHWPSPVTKIKWTLLSHFHIDFSKVTYPIEKWPFLKFSQGLESATNYTSQTREKLPEKNVSYSPFPPKSLHHIAVALSPSLSLSLFLSLNLSSLLLSNFHAARKENEEDHYEFMWSNFPKTWSDLQHNA